MSKLKFLWTILLGKPLTNSHLLFMLDRMPEKPVAKVKHISAKSRYIEFVVKFPRPKDKGLYKK